MISTLISIPLFALLVMVQSAIVSRLPLLRGFPDLILLTMIAWALHERVTTSWQWGILGGIIAGYMSAIPIVVPIAGYLGAIAMARVFQHRIWKTPLLAMFLTTFLATLFYHGLTIGALQFAGTRFSIEQAVNLITLPSILLNLALALPVYGLVKELADWLYPVKIEL